MLLEKVKTSIKKYRMVKKGDTLVVGVSGGADSVALLHILCVLCEEFGFFLHVVHVHHGLRGEEADHDAQFVEHLCKKWDVEYTTFYFDVKAEAKKRGCGEEEAGRILRYRAFRQIANKINGNIVVAHHRDDQSETVLMRLCRGSGLKGLRGMTPVNGDILRPLLFCSRKEIEEYCEKNELQYCNDRTNEEEIYTRNKIRLQLLPWLEREINPKSGEHIARSAEILGVDEDFLQQEAEKAWKQANVFSEGKDVFLYVSFLKQLHPALRRRVLRLALEHVQKGVSDLSYDHILKLESLLDKETGKKLSLPNGLCGEIQYEMLRLFLNNMNKDKEFCYKILPEKTIFIKEINKYVRLSFNAEKKQGNLPSIYTNQFDYDKIGDILYCRSRQKGDKLAIGGGHEKKLKDFFIDEKVPANQRDNVPLIACNQDILWAVGYRKSTKFGVDDRTKNIIWIQIWEENNEGKSRDPHFRNGDSQAD